MTAPADTDLCSVPGCWCGRDDQTDPAWPAYRWSADLPDETEQT